LHHEEMKSEAGACCEEMKMNMMMMVMQGKGGK
jgi:hypothetical protein